MGEELENVLPTIRSISLDNSNCNFRHLGAFRVHENSDDDINYISTDCKLANDGDEAATKNLLKSLRSLSFDMTIASQNFFKPRTYSLNKIFRKTLAKSPIVRRLVAMQDSIPRTICKHQTASYWTDSKIYPDEHIWLPLSGPRPSAATYCDNDCYIGEEECERIGEKRLCIACHIVVHSSCIPLLRQANMNCKTTCCDSSSKSTLFGVHHWIQHRKHEGRCASCQKPFQQKIFREKEVIAISCSWCKRCYHSKTTCFLPQSKLICDGGILKKVIIPPSWIVHNSVLSHRSDRKLEKIGQCGKHSFILRPFESIECEPTNPFLVFVNPKSGGNKGLKTLRALCWLINPRQVFDITAFSGPRFALELYKNVPQLRVLVCGGDGTVGWLLATLDLLAWPNYPPVAVLPYGTGNDLSRCLGWGGCFTSESLGGLLLAIIQESSVVHLDRWRLDVERNSACGEDAADDVQDTAQYNLPLSVMNNYFSIGADAHIALQFHHSRSANPQMLNSRFRNRIAYGGLGTIDLFKRTWKDLSDYITLECDGVDLTSKVKEFKYHCMLFQNIPYYAGGTLPWGNAEQGSSKQQSTFDDKIEVLGFTTASLAALQVGGRGERITQCSYAKIITTKAIPMQVDGEPCLLAPSVITLSFHNKVPMLRRNKREISDKTEVENVHTSVSPNSDLKPIALRVLVVDVDNYQNEHEFKEAIKENAFDAGVIMVCAEADLQSTRSLIGELLKSNQSIPQSGKDWLFLDYMGQSGKGAFCTMPGREQSTIVSDICNLECIVILYKLCENNQEAGLDSMLSSDFGKLCVVSEATSCTSHMQGSSDKIQLSGDVCQDISADSNSNSLTAHLTHQATSSLEGTPSSKPIDDSIHNTLISLKESHKTNVIPSCGPTESAFFSSDVFVSLENPDEPQSRIQLKIYGNQMETNL